MKKLILTITAIAALFCGCNGVTELNDRVGDLENRVDALENLVEEANKRIDLIKTLVDAQESNLYVEDISEITDGIKITLSNGKSYAIRNGEKGTKGDKGIQGDKGDPGAAPVVTVDVFEGKTYWKVNGEWILLGGEKVSAIGVTPQLKISEDKKWMISYDSGLSWAEVAPAYDESTAITITQTDDEVVFTLHDNTEYRIAKVPGFKFKVSDVEAIAMAAGSTRDIPYTVGKGDETVRFIVQSENYSAKVMPADNASGVIRVTAPDPIVEGWVLITAVQNSTGETKSQYLEFGHGDVAVVLDAQQVETLGGTAKVALRTNIAYSVDIPAADQEWISLLETRAYKVDTLVFSVKPNYTGALRQSTVTITPEDGTPTSFVISQEGEAISPEFGIATATTQSKDYGADTLLVKVTGTVLWTLELSEGLTASKMAGAGPADVIVNIPANDQTGVKVRTVTVKTDNASIAEKSITITVNQAGAPDPNDYYARFMAGEDIVINGETFNKDSYPVAPRLLKLYEFEKADDLVQDVASKGILFLDWDPADGKQDVYAPLFNLKPANVVIIGRYRNHQPHIDLSVNGNLSWGPTAGKVVFKNVELTTKNYMFLTGNATEPVSFSIEDCTLNCNSFYIFCESKAGGFLKDVIINNSVINFTRGLWGNTGALTSGTELTNFTKFHVSNSVLYNKTSVAYPLFPFRPSSTTYYATPNLDINLDHCTIYNSQSNNLGVLAMYSASKINFNYCVCEAPLAGKTSTIVMVPAVLNPKVTESTISDNYGNNSAANDLKWAYGYSAATNSGITVSGNKFVIGATPFSSADTATGYFPVDTSVVTNGAGASYDTKLWKSWE